MTITTSENCSCPIRKASSGCASATANIIETEPDQYGQCHPIETDELIQRSILDFNLVLLNHIPNHKKLNVTNAERQCPSLLTDSFKLMFLRCECFKVDLAVKRYVKYWDKRVEAFGPKFAFQPLTLNGPLHDATVPLEIGAMQIIQRNDARNILYFDPSKLDKTKYSRESAQRAFWYIFHVLLEDIDVQKRGVIVLNYNEHFRNSNRDPPLTKMFFNTMKGALPIRISVIHGCHVPYFYSCVIAIMMIFLGDRLRKRVIVHDGTHEQVIKSLEKYGISISDVPTDMGGLYELDTIAWLNERRNNGL